MIALNELFGQGFDIYKFLTSKAQSNNIHKKMIIREIRDNIKRLELRNRTGVNLNLLIQKLDNTSLVKAMENNYQLNKVAGNIKIEPDDCVSDKFTKYIGWDAEKLLNSIDGKLVALKDILDIFPDLNRSGINITTRLNNLYIQYILVSLLLRKASMA